MKFVYTNYKNETAERDVEVLSIDFLTNPGFGYAPGWFITGRDRDRKGDVRSFRIDERMLPTEADFNAPRHRHPGLTLVEYPITETHDIKSAVQKIQDSVTESLDEA